MSGSTSQIVITTSFAGRRSFSLSQRTILLMLGLVAALPTLLVWNKADLGFEREGLCISLQTGAGLSMLQDLLQQKVQQKLENGDNAPLLTRPRHRQALGEALEALRHGAAAPVDRPELLAEDLRLAMRAVGRITGRVDVEELLDFVFRDFCIGK